MARNANALRPRSPRRAIRYIPASIIPQARLQPSAANSIVRISKRSAVATPTAPVMVRAIIKPNRISESRSTGSSTRSGSLMNVPRSVARRARRAMSNLLLPAVSCQPLVARAEHLNGLNQHPEKVGYGGGLKLLSDLTMSADGKVRPRSVRWVLSANELRIAAKAAPHVGFGSLADITARRSHVRFAPDSRHNSDIATCPLCANSGHGS